MKTNRLQWLTAVVCIALTTLTLSACHDDDDVELTEEQRQQQAEEKATQQKDAFWDVVSQLTATGTWAEDYTTATFEPNIGKADKDNPLQRIVYVNDLAHAAKRFANLVGVEGIDETTSEYTFSDPAVGTLTYHRSGSGKELAYVDVNIRQLPTLQRIIYRDPSQAGENSWFTFRHRCYYRFGDVISRQRIDGVREYWICVRPAFGLEKKEDSHWVSLSPLPGNNVWEYYSKTTNKFYRLPNALGTNKEQMQNLAELLYAMNQPTQWAQQVQSNKKVDFFHDFSRSSYQYQNEYFFYRVGKLWQKYDLYKKTMGIASDAVASVLNSGLHLIYGNKSWSTTFSWKPSVSVATYKSGGQNGKANMHDYAYTTVSNSVRESGFDITTLYSQQAFPIKNFSSFFGNNDYYWCIRHATGEELSENGEYDITMPIPGMTEEYTYYGYYGLKVSEDDDVEQTESADLTENRSYYGMSYYRIGDVVRDQHGNSWFCIQPSGTGLQAKAFVDQYGYPHSDCSWFISMSGGFNGDANHYTNLPTQKEAKAIVACIQAIINSGPRGTQGNNSRFMISYNNILQYAGVDLMKLAAARDTLFYQADPSKPYIAGRTNHTYALFSNIAYSDPQYEGQKVQPLYRFILNNAWYDRKPNGELNYDGRAVQYLGQTRYAMGQRETMFLQDVMSQQKVNQYGRDNWVTLPWFTRGNNADPNTSPSSGGQTGYAKDVFPHQKPRTTTYRAVDCTNYLWNTQKADFAFPEFTSMYNEPVIICRLMAVRDRGEENPYALNGNILSEVSMVEGNYSSAYMRADGFMAVDNLANNFLIAHQEYIEDGERVRLLFLGQ